MLKPKAILTCLIFVGSIGTLNAAPLDSPGIIYIDGLPCNSACQAYMAWSRRVAEQRAPVSSQAVASPQSLTAKVQRKTKGTKAVTARVAKVTAQKRNAALNNAILLRKDSAKAKAGSPTVPTPRSDLETGKTPEQVATSPKELTIAAPHPEDTAEIVSKPSESTGAISPADANTTLLGSPNADQSVAILLVRTEIKSVTDLANKIVAIDVSQSSSVPRVRNALVSAGVTDVQLSEDKKLAVIRVINGEVPAGVVSLTSPEEAAMWKGVAGFNVLRIPLAPLSEKAGRG